jgi:phenylacetate-CoA ligase
VPFYREYWGDHGVTFFRPAALEELTRYPVLTKAVFRAHAERVRPDNLAAIPHVAKHTGGTTGEPVHYHLDLAHWSLMQAFHEWGWSQAGHARGDPAAVIAGGSLIDADTTLALRLRRFAERRLFLFGVHMDETLARRHHAQLAAFAPRVLYGYPSVLYLLSRFLRTHGLTLPSVRAVITTAEMLHPHYRAGIEAALGCRVFDNLGCNDGGFESFECREHAGFHYNDYQAVLEVDRPNPEGTGRLLVTNLWNRSTPFIRYENGDLARLEATPCACGSGFPRIAAIEGRTADILSFANGRSLSGPALTLIFAPLAIEGWQVVQTAPDNVEVRLRQGAPLEPRATQRIAAILNHHLGPEVNVSIRRVDALEVTAAGKRKPVWSEVPAFNCTSH